MTEGWIKLHRSILDWKWYHDPAVWRLWMHLLLKANFATVEKGELEFKRGQLYTGLKVLSSETGLSQQQIRTALKKLEKTGEINIQSTNRFSIITIVKYDDYQSQNSEQQSNNNQSTNEQQTDNNQPTNNQQHNKKEKNDNNEKNEKNNMFFETFWKQTYFPKRPQDTKGDMKKKYMKLLKEKVKPEDILFSSDIFAEKHKNDKFCIGLRKFLDSKENIEQYLKGDFKEEKESTSFERNKDSLKKALQMLGE